MARVTIALMNCITMLFARREKLVNSCERNAAPLYITLLEQSHCASSPSSRSQAGGVLKQIREPMFLLTLYLFQDVLTVLGRTCKLWQTACMDISAISSAVRSSLAQITAMKELPVSHWADRAKALAAKVTAAVRAYEDKIKQKEAVRREKEKKEIAALKQQQNLIEAEAEERGEEFVRKTQKPQKLKGNFMHDCKTFDLPITDKAVQGWDKPVRQAFLQAVVDNITSRFPDDDIVSALNKLFNPECLPDKYSATYGLDSLDVVIAHFGVKRAGEKPIIDGAEARAEWPTFFHKLLEAKFAEKKLEDSGQRPADSRPPTRMGRVLKAVLSTDYVQSSAPNIVMLADIALVYCIGTVPCESGFSYVKLAKSPLRSVLGDDMLEAEMLVQLEGPDPELFTYGAAVRWWYKKNPKRRLMIQDIDACKDTPPLGYSQIDEELLQQIMDEEAALEASSASSSTSTG